VHQVFAASARSQVPKISAATLCAGAHCAGRFLGTKDLPQRPARTELRRAAYARARSAMLA
jgi:hypothetical protein